MSFLTTISAGLLLFAGTSIDNTENMPWDSASVPYNNLETQKILTVSGGTNPHENQSVKPIQELRPEHISHYDSLAIIRQQSSLSAFDNFFADFIDIDDTQYIASDIPDSVYEARLKMIVSPIPMPFNHLVRTHIIAYTSTKKAVMSRIIGRSQYYMPMIETHLDKAGLPLELRMLPGIESAFLPTALSRQGASGLWQFMYATGKSFGLEITSFIDQRRDPEAATVAACGYLKQLHGIYGDWLLAIAAYNCGPGNVNKAIARSGGGVKTFWDIYPYLPRETRAYVPSFIAATYAYTFHKQHNIIPEETSLPLATDTVLIDRLMHFKQVSSTIGLPIEVIRSLNPQYKADIIPAVNNKSYSLTLPMSELGKYLEKEHEIMAKDTLYLAEYLNPANINKMQKALTLQATSYKVKKGDTLSSIASKHGVKVSQLMKWNNIKNPNQLKIGQRIEIHK